MDPPGSGGVEVLLVHRAGEPGRDLVDPGLFSLVEVLTMCPTGWFVPTKEGPGYLDRVLGAVHGAGELEGDGKLLARTILEKPVLIYRGASGRVVALDNRCSHRGARLSYGRMEGDGIRCRYCGSAFSVEVTMVSRSPVGALGRK